MLESMLQEQEKGIMARLAELRKKRDAILRADGIREEIAKLRTELIKAEQDIEVKGAILFDLKIGRNEVIMQSVSALTDRMKRILPESKTPVIEVSEDGKVSIGVKEGDRHTAYAGLSGGEKCEFDLALSLALSDPEKEKLLILEAAEADPERLNRLMEKIVRMPETGSVQIVVNTWYRPETVPEGWKVWQIN